ncbi:MAG: DUF4097 family beta strand repeat-containing protein [Candidatus Baltobacteraceae bacterium]
MRESARYARGIPLLLACTLAGCTGTFGERVREQFHQSVPVTGSPVVHVDNIAGAVRVDAWDKPAVDVQATKYGYDAAELRRVTIAIHTEGNGIFIATTYAGGARHGGVRYTISVPANSALQISNVAGLVAIGGVRGDVNVETQAGAIAADVGRVDGGRSIDLSATTGAIALSIAPGSSASVEAQSVVGAFSSDVPGLSETRDHLVGSRATGKIGAGAARIRLNTTTGAIAVRERS